MKIALVYDLIYPFSIGGAEARNLSLAKHLALKGHEVHLFGVKMWKGNSQIKIAKNIYAHGVSKYSGKYSFSGKRKIIEPIIYSIRLFFEFNKYNFDLIDVSAFPYFPVFSCKLYCTLKKKPLNITWHEVWDDYWNEYFNYSMIKPKIGRLIEKITAKMSINNICVSEHVAKKFRKISKKPAATINNWVECNNLKKVKPLEHRYDIISVGRHLRHKNFDLLLRICAILKKTHPNLKALILGEGPETIRLLHLRHSLDLDKNVDILSFTKHKEEMHRYLKSGKVFVLLSELEGFSIVSFEAMALGLPVITLNSEKNALKDFIEDGKNGFSCQKNEAIISEKISRVLNSKELYKKMSRHAIDTAQRYDAKEQIEKIEAYFEALK